jgi:hypothetical protein
MTLRNNPDLDARGMQGSRPLLTGKCPASPALQGGVKSIRPDHGGHNMKEKYLTGKPRPLETVS